MNMTLAIALLFANAKILTLADALQTAQKAQPSLRQAHAATEAAKDLTVRRRRSPDLDHGGKIARMRAAGTARSAK